MNLHRLAEERSIAFHRAVAERLLADPRVLARAKDRVNGWLAHGSPHSLYARAWAQILSLPLEELTAALEDPSEHARALRQVTPFAGALPPRERWAIWRDVARAHGRGP